MLLIVKSFTLTYNWGMKKDTYWKSEAIQIIRAAKARQGYDWDEISKQLKKQYGIDIGAKSLSAKISQGTFSFVFALQILSTLEIKMLEIPNKNK